MHVERAVASPAAIRNVCGGITLPDALLRAVDLIVQDNAAQHWIAGVLQVRKLYRLPTADVRLCLSADDPRKR
jgi:hypothetical protein